MQEKTMASEEENHFDRLPEELILYIFDKISDAKCLCICSSVSKSFATFVLRSRVLFVEMPAGNVIEVCSCHPDPSADLVPPVERYSRLMFSLLRYIPGFLLRPLLFLLLRAAIFVLKLLKFLLSLGDKTDVSQSGIINSLKRFSCLESITIHFPLRQPDATNSQPRSESLLRWKFGLSGFIFVSAKWCFPIRDEFTALISELDSNVHMATDLTREEIIILFFLMRHHFIDSMLRVALVHDIVAVLPNIKYVATVDDMKQGKVVLEEDEIAIMKEENPFKTDNKVMLKLWKAQLVILPLSGCIMGDVSLILIRPIEGCDTSVVEKSFEEDEYCELATSLVKEEASFEGTFSISKILSH